MGCFHFFGLWIMLLWTFVYKFLCEDIFSFLLGVYLGMELLGYMVTLCLVPWVIAILFSEVVASFYIPTSNVWGFQFFHILTNTYYVFLNFYSSHSSGCGYKLVSHCGFDLHFPDGWWCWASFHVLIGYLCIFFGKMSIQVHCPFINCVICLFIIEW